MGIFTEYVFSPTALKGSVREEYPGCSMRYGSLGQNATDV